MNIVRNKPLTLMYCYYTLYGIPYYTDTDTGVEEAIPTAVVRVAEVALELAARAALELGAP